VRGGGDVKNRREMGDEAELCEVSRSGLEIKRLGFFTFLTPKSKVPGRTRQANRFTFNFLD